MPPKVKFTKKEILDTAFAIVRKEGLEALTARSLGEALGCSPRPVFTAFNGMEELNEEVIRCAKDLYNSYIAQGLRQEIPFKGVGAQYIRFAMQEPQLFRLLFMREVGKNKSIGVVLPEIDENYGKILAAIQIQYGFSPYDARCLYRHLWTYTHGIATMSVTGVCDFTAEEIGEMMSEVCLGLIMYMRGRES